jgi:Holliday junction resolvasome RuvABC endonuclease subunit
MKVLLALYPNTRGFGYACLETCMKEKKLKLLDFGIINVRPAGNEKILKHVRKFAQYFKPEFVILRDYHKPTNRGRRIRDLIGCINQIAEQHQLSIHRYTREQVRYVFEQYGAKTKYEIAQKLIEAFPELASRAPKIRKPWEDEDYHMGVFDAIALATTHLYLS